MFAGMLFGLILVMKLFPETPAARAMHRGFVEAPLRKLAAMTRRHVIYAVVAAGMLVSGMELIMILGSSDLLLLMAWDMSLYVDAVIATWTVAAVTRIKGFWHALKARMGGVFRRASRPRARRSSAGARPAANDSDDEGPGWYYARAA